MVRGFITTVEGIVPVSMQSCKEDALLECSGGRCAAEKTFKMYSRAEKLNVENAPMQTPRFLDDIRPQIGIRD